MDKPQSGAKPMRGYERLRISGTTIRADEILFNVPGFPSSGPYVFVSIFDGQINRNYTVVSPLPTDVDAIFRHLDANKVEVRGNELDRPPTSRTLQVLGFGSDEFLHQRIFSGQKISASRTGDRGVVASDLNASIRATVKYRNSREFLTGYEYISIGTNRTFQTFKVENVPSTTGSSYDYVVRKVAEAGPLTNYKLSMRKVIWRPILERELALIAR